MFSHPKVSKLQRCEQHVFQRILPFRTCGTVLVAVHLTSYIAHIPYEENTLKLEVSLCTDEGLFPRSDHCRLLILCLKSKTQGSQFKEYLLSCPYGLNFNHFMMTCYDFKQECALEKGHGVNQKLAKAWTLTLPKESESCRGAKAPFCTDEDMLTICHPFSKKVLGYVNCKEKDAAHSYCDEEEGMCKRGTTSTTEQNNANGVIEGTIGANFLQVVALCSASLKGAEAKRCVELFGKEYECLASEDRCPVYIAELIHITDGTMLQSVEASIHIYASMGSMNVQTVVGRPTNDSTTQNQCDGDIINGAMKLQKCQKPGGNCLSDGDTLMDCYESLHIKRAYRCSDVYGDLAECVPKLQECVELADSRFIFESKTELPKRKKGRVYN
ncbi:uncharacterized protein LOC126335907 [Schistocerca gregaria]|uniref:uncharacterized protein LOC126335907 n=1 Tax=Schistocerca gregaria TaxID=7010 RepID=UPI00211EA303|nr:uncharacterized protein LOC126335907 [Schistocerca gregaria]